MLQNDHRFKAFISYSHADEKWAKWLHDALERYRTPKRLVSGSVPARLTPVFRDRVDLASSYELSESIRDALTGAENLIVICSPAAVASRWVNQEIELFKRLGRSDRIFCLIVAGDPGIAGAPDDCFPPALRARFDPDGELLAGESEPVAADARSDTDGRATALTKLVAGLLNVALDDLRQREQQRRYRRMAAVTAGALVVMAVTIALATDAVIARGEADRRRAQAEELLNFMVVDLRDSLEPIGRLDLMEKVSEKAMAYFALVDVDNLSDDELARHAQVLTQLGKIRSTQGDYDEALTSFEQAFERSAALVADEPGNGDRLFDRGQAEFWVGFVHWRRGALDDARTWMNRYLASSVALAALDPNRADWRTEIAYGHHNLAVLAVDAGDLASAEESFLLELDMLESLQRGATDFDGIRDQADVVSWLGSVAMMRGDLAGALDRYGRSSRTLGGLSRGAPEDRNRVYDWAHGLYLEARAKSVLGDLNGASELLDQVIAMTDALIAHDASNLHWRSSNARAQIAKGNVLAARGDWEAARERAAQARSALAVAVGEAALDVDSHETLADAYLLDAWISLGVGEAANGLALSQQALDHMLRISQLGRLNDEGRGKLASIYVARGQLEAASGDNDRAKASWQQALDLMTTRAATRHPFLLDPWARALTLGQRQQEASKIVATLNAVGYQPLNPWPRTTDF